MYIYVQHQRLLDPFPLESLQFVINEIFQNCSIKYGHKKIFFLLVLRRVCGAGRGVAWRNPQPCACLLLATRALTCSLCALWSLWWVWVSGPLLPPKRLKKQMKQNYREWMETYNLSGWLHRAVVWRGWVCLRHWHLCCPGCCRGVTAACAARPLWR